MKTRKRSQPRPLQNDRRRRWAWLACALWFVGFDVGPLTHLACHDVLAAHLHGHDATTLRAESLGHEHPQPVGSPHEHSTAPRPSWRGHGSGFAGGFATWFSHTHEGSDHSERSDPGGTARDAVGDDGVNEDGVRDDGVNEGEAPLDHGDGSLAHRDVAALLPLPGLPAVPEAPFVGYVAAHTYLVLLRDGRPTTRRARGPPASTNIPHPT